MSDDRQVTMPRVASRKLLQDLGWAIGEVGRMLSFGAITPSMMRSVMNVEEAEHKLHAVLGDGVWPGAIVDEWSDWFGDRLAGVNMVVDLVCVGFIGPDGDLCENVHVRKFPAHQYAVGSVLPQPVVTRFSRKRDEVAFAFQAGDETVA